MLWQRVEYKCFVLFKKGCNDVIFSLFWPSHLSCVLPNLLFPQQFIRWSRQVIKISSLTSREMHVLPESWHRHPIPSVIAKCCFEVFLLHIFCLQLLSFDLLDYWLRKCPTLFQHFIVASLVMSDLQLKAKRFSLYTHIRKRKALQLE